MVFWPSPGSRNIAGDTLGDITSPPQPVKSSKATGTTASRFQIRITCVSIELVDVLATPISWVACLLLASQAVLAQSPPSVQAARAAYENARAHFDSATTNVSSAWELGRAAFDLADLTHDTHERAAAAQAGINACHQATALDPNSAPAHYYLALDMGELARTKYLGALRLLREMERELSKAAQLDPALDYGGPDRSLGILYLDAPSPPLGVGNRNKARSHLQEAVQLAPDYPENRIALAEAYAQWGELANLQHELVSIRELLPNARAHFSGPEWSANWSDWESRLAKLQAIESRLSANSRFTPSERGGRRELVR